jgi:hypothetical protein
MERWGEEAKAKPTMQSGFNYLGYKAAEWGFNYAMEPDPTSLKAKALRGLDRIQKIDVVPVWIGKDVFDTIREALNRIPD